MDASITLGRGAQIPLEKPDGTPLDIFSVVCTWESNVRRTGFLGLRKKIVETDLDLSCVMFDATGRMTDHIYSPLFRPEFLGRYGLPQGKVDSKDKALHHSGELLEWTSAEHLNRETITVDLTHIDPDVARIFFFLNDCGPDGSADIPRSLMTIVGEDAKPFASFAVAPRQGGKSLIMARLDIQGDRWRLTAIGDAITDRNLCETIRRISDDYLG